MHRKWAPLFLMWILYTVSSAMQSYHLAWSHVYPPSIVFASLSFTGLWPVHPVVPDPSDPQTHTNTDFTECVCMCPFPLASQRKWLFGGKSLLAVSSVSLCCKYPKDVPAVFVFNPVRMLVMFLSY